MMPGLGISILQPPRLSAAEDDSPPPPPDGRLLLSDGSGSGPDRELLVDDDGTFLTETF